MHIHQKTRTVTKPLVEGNSVRSTARMMGMQIGTVSTLLSQVGSDCADLLRSRIQDIDVNHLELDEIWTFVYKQQKRVKPDDPPTVGAAHCYITLDRAGRPVLARHLGRRDEINTLRFIQEVRKSTSSKRLRISTDGWPAYEYATKVGLSDRTSYGRLVKLNCPKRVDAVLGNLDTDEVETTYIECFNGTVRQWCKRFKRKSYAFSRKWEELESALALVCSAYNYCRAHTTLRMTPAMAVGLTDRPWTIRELLEEPCL